MFIALETSFPPFIAMFGLQYYIAFFCAGLLKIGKIIETRIEKQLLKDKKAISFIFFC